MISAAYSNHARPLAMLAGLLVCLLAGNCVHSAVVPLEPASAGANGARALELAAARPDSARPLDAIASHGDVAPAPRAMHFESTADSLDFENNRQRAEESRGYRIIISLFDRRLWVVDGTDTLRSALAAVAMDSTLAYAGHVWRFDTPRGRRTVRSKSQNPLWVPPDWHYAEVAKENHLALSQVPRKGAVKIANGRKLEVRQNQVGLLVPDSGWTPLPLDEEVVFDDTLYMPPLGTKNRRIYGELGSFRLDMGDGYLIHGTPEESTVGDAVTHGCVRLREDDIAWLYANVPVGTGVYIF